MVYPTLRKGSAAYYDSLTGPIPVRVLEIKEVPRLFNLKLGYQATKYEIKVEVTMKMHGFREGETFDTTGLRVFPKECLWKRGFNYTILPFAVEATR